MIQTKNASDHRLIIGGASITRACVEENGSNTVPTATISDNGDSETLDFLQAMYPRNDIPGVLNLWTKNQNGSRRSFWFPPSLLMAASNQARALAKTGNNVYFGVAPRIASLRGTHRRGGQNETTGIPGLWCDLDIAGPNHVDSSLPPDEDAASFLLAQFPLPPSLIVATGGGWHAYWLFNEFWQFSTSLDRAKAKDLCNGFARTFSYHAAQYNWTFDSAPTGDLARVLRLPGTFNYKNAPFPVHLMFQSERRYDPSELAAHFVNGSGPLPRPLPVHESEVIPEGRRDTTLFRIAAGIRGRQHSADEERNRTEILEELRRINQSRCRPPLPDIEVEDRVTSVMKYNPGTGSLPKKADSQPAESEAAEVPVDADPDVWEDGIYASCMDRVKAERLRWIWRGYIPKGKITIVEGDGGKGKSLVTLDIASRVTRCDPMPDRSKPDLSEPGAVLLMGLEDGKADTVRPRLDAMNADTSRVFVWEANRDAYGGLCPASLSIEDLPRLETLIRKKNIVMLIVDTLTGVLPSYVDSHKDQSIRSVLGPLARMAERLGVTILLIRHWTKGVAARASDKGIGSVGIRNIARSQLAVGDDPSCPGRRAVGQHKMNLVSNDIPSFGFQVVEAENGQPRIEWTGPTTCSAEDIIMQVDDTQESRTSREEARDFLLDFLAEGPVDSNAVNKAAKEAGITKAAFRRAKLLIESEASERLGKPFKMAYKEGSGTNGRWYLKLPDFVKVLKESQRCSLPESEHLREKVSTFENPYVSTAPSKTDMDRPDRLPTTPITGYDTSHLDHSSNRIHPDYDDDEEERDGDGFDRDGGAMAPDWKAGDRVEGFVGERWMPGTVKGVLPDDRNTAPGYAGRVEVQMDGKDYATIFHPGSLRPISRVGA